SRPAQRTCERGRNRIEGILSGEPSATLFDALPVASWAPGSRAQPETIQSVPSFRHRSRNRSTDNLNLCFVTFNHTSRPQSAPDVIPRINNREEWTRMEEKEESCRGSPFEPHRRKIRCNCGIEQHRFQCPSGQGSSLRRCVQAQACKAVIDNKTRSAG